MNGAQRIGNTTIYGQTSEETYEPDEQELFDYARAILGLELPQDQDLMWIAREGLRAPLPPGWRACEADDGDFYFYNFETGESSWDHPCDEYYRVLVREEKQKRKVAEPALLLPTIASGEKPTTTSPSATTPLNANLPELASASPKSTIAPNVECASPTLQPRTYQTEKDNLPEVLLANPTHLVDSSTPTTTLEHFPLRGSYDHTVQLKHSSSSSAITTPSTSNSETASEPNSHKQSPTVHSVNEQYHGQPNASPSHSPSDTERRDRKRQRRHHELASREAQLEAETARLRAALERCETEWRIRVESEEQRLREENLRREREVAHLHTLLEKEIRRANAERAAFEKKERETLNAIAELTQLVKMYQQASVEKNKKLSVGVTSATQTEPVAGDELTIASKSTQREANDNVEIRQVPMKKDEQVQAELQSADKPTTDTWGWYKKVITDEVDNDSESDNEVSLQVCAESRNGQTNHAFSEEFSNAKLEKMRRILDEQHENILRCKQRLVNGHGTDKPQETALSPTHREAMYPSSTHTKHLDSSEEHLQRVLALREAELAELLARVRATPLPSRRYRPAAIATTAVHSNRIPHPPHSPPPAVRYARNVYVQAADNALERQMSGWMEERNATREKLARHAAWLKDMSEQLDSISLGYASVKSNIAHKRRGDVGGNICRHHVLSAPLSAALSGS